MKIMDRIGGAEGVKVIIGSGFFWAWMDALFMSAFFITPQSQGIMSELAFVAVFACTVPLSVFGLARRSRFAALLASKRFMALMALVGSAGSLLFLAAGVADNAALVALGGLLGGCFMASFGAAWGACYCSKGAQSATPFVTGAFAFAPLADIPLLLMVPFASSVFFALLPIASFGLLLSVGAPCRAFGLVRKGQGDHASGARDYVRRYLGLSITLIGAAMLVTFGFGYLQHLISFSPITQGGELGGIVVQIARGVTSVALFILFMLLPQKMSAVYRVGFLVMVAGVMMVPFFFGGDFFAVPGAVIIAGYTVFDVFIWVIFCHIAQSESDDPLKTIVLIRLVASLFSVAGAIVGIVLVGPGSIVSEFASQETTVVGYLIVIAIVLILSGEDSRGLFASTKTSRVIVRTDSAEDAGTSDLVDTWFTEAGLTMREREIAGHLMQGRTQPWIAEALGISENTVGTHVRHIYQKTDVHDRQQFIDQSLWLASPEARDASSPVTEPC